MRSLYIPTKAISSLTKELNLLNSERETKAILFLMADENHYSEDVLCPLLRSISKPVIGGVFPEIIYKNQRKKSGVLLLALSFEIKTQVFDLSLISEEFDMQFKNIEKELACPVNSLFVFMDCLSQNKRLFIESLFNLFGMQATYFGGGTGSLSFEKFPCIISNNGLHCNAAIIGWGKQNMSLGVAHGWHSISDILKVTETKDNLIKSINWKPAFEIYKEIVDLHSDSKITMTNFSDIAKSYPLGIEKLDAEMVVRDPIGVSEEGIHFVNVVTEGEYVKILHGDIESLLRGAQSAKELAVSKFSAGMNTDSMFCIDCISRVLFMQDEYSRELDIISENKNISGVLSIGEIANEGDAFLEVYNKTIALAIW